LQINMRVEIISVGDELLIGQVINTNASWIGAQLLEAGIQADWITTVGDQEDRISEALRIAQNRADIVLLTGGLGPTHDDVTKKVLCQYFDSELVLDNSTLEHIKALFHHRGIPMSKVNEAQALIPDQAEVIFNDRGTAPGLRFRQNGKLLYVMPGVPFEMKSMMQRAILPEIQELVGNHRIATRVLCTIGIAESSLAEKLGDIAAIEKFAKVAFLPSPGGIRIRLTAAGKDAMSVRAALDQAELLIRAKANEYIFAAEDIPLEEAIAKTLIAEKRTVAIAESCTGGLIAHKLTNISGSSNYLDRAVISYSNTAKMELLAVSIELIEKQGAVSAEVACAMAEGVRRMAHTDFGISTTGIAGPTGGTAQKPVGLVYVAVADEAETVWERHQFTDDRLTNKERFAYSALNLLRKRLLGIEIRHGKN